MWIFFTLQSSLTSPSEADLLLRLLAWPQVTGEILILLFRKGSGFVTANRTFGDGCSVGKLHLPTWLHTGCLKSLSRNKADNSP